MPCDDDVAYDVWGYHRSARFAWPLAWLCGHCERQPSFGWPQGAYDGLATHAHSHKISLPTRPATGRERWVSVGSSVAGQPSFRRDEPGGEGNGALSRTLPKFVIDGGCVICYCSLRYHRS